MSELQRSANISPLERIRRTNPAGNEVWSSRDFAHVLDYTDYRNFEAVIEKARTACFSSGQHVEDHFVEITEMLAIGRKVRQTIQELGGTMPEELPPAASIKKLEAKAKKLGPAKEDSE
mgnify:CR=1 FL=1